MSIHIVLFEPEIPQNTGNIARTCACTGAHLHLVEPMGFRLTEKHLGRAAMDYWNDVNLTRWPSTQAFLDEHGTDDLHLFTGQAKTNHTQVQYAQDTYLIFGRESRGIDQDIIDRHHGSCVRIPMAPECRSLNLSNAVAIGVYEVLRQTAFNGLA